MRAAVRAARQEGNLEPMSAALCLEPTPARALIKVNLHIGPTACTLTPLPFASS